jgi:tRNA threonylcarbamoyladenosine biosynthesis protein TsaE
MGAGKTTLISAVTKILGVTDTASSPTFSLVNNYRKENEVFYHFDFYRLNHPDEALDFGLEEYLESGNLCFLEWAEKVSTHLPLEYDHFVIKEQKDGSRIIEKINPLKS